MIELFDTQYKNLILEYQRKYGRYSQIDFLLNLEYLGKLLDNPTRNFSMQQVETEQILRNMELPSLGEAPITYTEDKIIFSSKEYSDRYGDTYAELLNTGLFELNPKTYESHKQNWYMYVVNSNNEIILLDKPYSQIEMLADRDDFPPHPAMVQNNLTVKAAGEIYVGENNDFIITNKSGHFRPKVEHLNFVTGLLRSNFPNSRIISLDFGIKKED